MAISSLGVGSGLALEDLVTQLVQAERRPKLEALQKRENDVSVSLSGYSKLKSGLSKVLESLEKLSDPDKMNSKAAIINGQSSSSVSSSDDEEAETSEVNPYLSATVSRSAAEASYQISVESLAQGTKAKSAAFSSADEVITTTAGTLTLATASGDNTFSVDVGAGATLQDIANSINSSEENYGVSASIINTGGSNPETRLVLSSNLTGEANELVVSNDNAELDSVSTVATGAAAGLSIAAEDQARDAKMIVDGIEVFSSTNTFTNAITGVEIVAKQASPGNEQSLEVTTDKPGVKQNIEEFVDAYNKFVEQANTLTRVNVEGKSGALVGDSMLRGLRAGLSNIVGGAVGSAPAGTNTLYAIGLSFDDDGKLSFGADGEAKLDKALDENFDGVSELFSNEDGIGSRLDGYIEQYTQRGGLFESKEDVFESNKENITKERERFERYMENFEKNLREEYQGLDAMLAQMNQTMTALQGQLASLPGFGGKS
ncbi:flagellar filament capping protein FliD [Idiomarina aquatica]|uniref:Flagellar hook-associated protein 2 n=1 Tax=Idiomarina aquatica TaxID=1327752 RepID=A0AA94EFU1_9GAMM|nr:flagellar filament capping protein FliD [Idiomarina aquatica]RUO45066.1 hypothetical protein CWE23_03325 [Idiomarina aquatica]